jgi:SAM-dependent methyltransferase
VAISDGTACPACAGALVEQGSALICERCGIRAATLHGSRAQWTVPLAPELQALVSAEAAQWDEWAAHPPLQRRVDGDVSDWLAGSRVYRALRRVAPNLERQVDGARMLDIGGTCLDAIKFVRSGVARVDQLEVSPASQAVAVANLQAAGIDWRGRVWFHTAPAEALPFQDGTFDIVFSRSTIHHTDRSRSIPEIARVLKPGATMLLVEAYRSPFMYRLTSARRAALGADRGTDDPLTSAEIAGWRGFDHVALYPFGALWTVWSQTADKLSQRWRRTIWNLDLRLGGFAGQQLGSQSWVIASTRVHAQCPRGEMQHPARMVDECHRHGVRRRNVRPFAARGSSSSAALSQCANRGSATAR